MTVEGSEAGHGEEFTHVANELNEPSGSLLDSSSIETDISAARMEQSGCWVDKDAAVWVASSSNSTVRMPGCRSVLRGRG